jgi:hypothetical protein
MVRPLQLFTAAGALFGVSLARPLNTDMDDCKYNPVGTPVPDDNTFFLPLEANRQSRCYPLCLDGDTVKCETPIPVCFGFKNHGITFTYSALPGYNYTQIYTVIDKQALSDRAITYDISQCDVSTDSGTVTCTLPYTDLVGGTTPTDKDVATIMCPNGDSEGYKFEFEMSADLVDRDGNVHHARDKESCTDYPSCQQISPANWWILSYRCTKCSNSGLPSSPSSPPATTASPVPTCTPTTVTSTTTTSVTTTVPTTVISTTTQNITYTKTEYGTYNLSSILVLHNLITLDPV